MEGVKVIYQFEAEVLSITMGGRKHREMVSFGVTKQLEGWNFEDYERLEKSLARKNGWSDAQIITVRQITDGKIQG